MTQFIGTSDIRALLGKTGIEPFLVGLAGYIEADFRRWEQFEKAARLASHSRDGVIELMPASPRRSAISSIGWRRRTATCICRSMSTRWTPALRRASAPRLPAA